MLYINIFYIKKVLATSFSMIAVLGTDYKLIKIDESTILFALAIAIILIIFF
jgi:hypothetical protein